MYQVSPRQSGKCFFCPTETDVVAFTKDRQTVKLCKRHLWDALKDAEPEEADDRGTPDRS